MRVAAIKCIWLNEKASFSGNYVNFDDIVAYPKRSWLLRIW